MKPHQGDQPNTYQNPKTCRTAPITTTTHAQTTSPLQPGNPNQKTKVIYQNDHPETNSIHRTYKENNLAHSSPTSKIRLLNYQIHLKILFLKIFLLSVFQITQIEVCQISQKPFFDNLLRAPANKHSNWMKELGGTKNSTPNQLQIFPHT